MRFDLLTLFPDMCRAYLSSSILGRAKRVAPEIWDEVARFVRSRKRRVCWFLGPDELDLETLLSKPGDSVEKGRFESVIRQHARCRYSMTHDSVHLHIRAHMPGETAAIFVRGESLEWGGYPYGVSLLDFSHDRSGDKIRGDIVEWFSSRLQ